MPDIDFQKIVLNLIPKKGDKPVIFYASQYETARPFIADLFWGESEFAPGVDCYAEIDIRKNDDNLVVITNDVAIDNNEVSVILPVQALTCIGKNLGQVKIYAADDQLIASLNFILEVQADPLAGGVTSETAIDNLTTQIDDIISGEGYVKDTDLEILQSDWNETDVSSPAYIKNKPGPALADQADWTETDPLKQSYIKHKPDLKTVATSGSYNDLTDKPTIPTKTSELTNDSGFVESSDLAAVATSGDYDDLLNKPTIPAAQVQSDWNQTNTSAVDFIKNKPDLMVVKSATGNPCTFTTDLADNLVSLTAEIVASGGGGTPSTPIPINGYTEANITRCGKNFLHMTVSNIKSVNTSGTWNDNTYTYNGITFELITSGDLVMGIKANATNPTNDTTFYIYFNNSILNGDYYFSGCPDGGSITKYDIYAWDITTNSRIKQWDGTTNSLSDFGNMSQEIKVNQNNTQCLVIRIRSGVALNNLIFYPMIRLASADSTFESYNGQTYTIAFGQTVYGGVLDVTRGKLKPCIEYSSYNGETLSGRWLSSEATYIEGTTPPTGSQVVSLDDYGSDIDLTPVQISALVGTNNITSDLGGNVNVRYVSGELAGQIIDICKMVIAEQGE